MARAPVRNASFVTDNQGVVRFAVGYGTDNRHELYYRSGEDAEWQLLNDKSGAGLRQWPMGFSADDRTAYLNAEQRQGPDAIIAFDTASQMRKQLMRDDDSDVDQLLYRNGTSVPIGALFMDGKPQNGVLRRNLV